MSKEFERQFLCNFQEDAIMKALKKSFVRVADKDRNLFLPQSIIRNGIESIRHGAKSEEVLVGVLEAFGSLVNDLHRQLIIKQRIEVQPIRFEPQPQAAEKGEGDANISGK